MKLRDWSLRRWLLVIALSGASGALFVSGKTKDEELAKLREKSQQAEAVQGQLEEAKSQAKILSDEIAGMQGDKQELLRLRNEIGQVRAQMQAAKTEVQKRPPNREACGIPSRSELPARTRPPPLSPL